LTKEDLTKIFRYEGTKKVPIEVGEAGDIVIIAGLENANVADTICDLEVDKPIDATPIDPPTMSIKVTVNSSPLAGTEGNKLNKHSNKRKIDSMKHKIMLELIFLKMKIRILLKLVEEVN
jgi:GTP-binding protein